MAATAKKDRTKSGGVVKEKETCPPFRVGRCPVLSGCICSSSSDNGQDSKTVSAANADKLRLQDHWAAATGVSEAGVRAAARSGFRAAPCWVICLQDPASEQRNARAMAMLHTHGLCRLARVFEATRPTDELMRDLGVCSRGKFGVWTSHQNIARLILGTATPSQPSALDPKQEPEDKGDPGIDAPVADDEIPRRVLVLESDAEWVPGYERRLPQLTAMLRKHEPDYDQFLLGHFPLYGLPVERDLSVFHTHSVMAHAYVLSRAGLKALAESDYLDSVRKQDKELDIDVHMKARFRQYALSPQIAVQGGRDATENTGNFRPDRELYDWSRFLTGAIGAHRVCVTYGGPAVDWLVFFGGPLLALLLAYWLWSSFFRVLLFVFFFAVLAIVAVVVTENYSSSSPPTAKIRTKVEF